MVKRLIGIVLGSAVYGFSIGWLHSPRLAAWNLIKFPLLIAVTCLLCAMAYYVFCQFITRRLSFRDVLGLSLRTYFTIAVLLASLSPVAFFLANTVVQPDARGLNEYPFFLGLNVCFIALCGTVALVRQTLGLVRQYGIALRRSVAIILVWLAISLFAGGQCAWYMRPYFGISTITDLPFMVGSEPDFRGATSFYEAVYNLINPPPLPEWYYDMDRPGGDNAKGRSETAQGSGSRTSRKNGGNEGRRRIRGDSREPRRGHSPGLAAVALTPGRRWPR